MSRIVIALGGNALLPKGKKGTAAEQLEGAKKVVMQIEPLLKNNQVVLTHGNGPQVGNLLLQQQGTKEVPEMPLDVLDAMTQGQIGYSIASAISLTGLHCATLITRVVVDESDPAFRNPTKPIGPFYEKKPETGNRKRNFVMDSNRGYRLVVPSPEPVKIREHDAIEACLGKGFVVIAVGGGGIPIKSDGHGLEAVIDKDKATALLASQINADMLVFITSIDAVYLEFGKKEQKAARKMTVKEAKGFLAKNQFAEGSMKPKIESVVRYLEKGGKKAVICSIQEVAAAIEGRAGTTITP